MAKEKPTELKAQVLAALMLGQSIHSVADQYKVPRTTVTRWRKEMVEAKAKEGTEDADPKKGTDIDTLIFKFLTETLETLSIQAKHFRDKAWLDKQDASDLAVLHGVQTDKAIRLLGALNPPD